MNRASPTTAGKRCDPIPTAAQASGAGRARIRLLLAAWLALLTGCSTPTTTVDQVWRDSARADHAALGKTLVLSIFPDAEVAIALENEWTRQLRSRGIQADAFEALLPGKRPPDKQSVVELVKSGGFDTLLVSRLVDVKRVERDVSAYQVAVVETKLYDAATEQPFWSARSDTFMVSPGGGPISNPRSELIRGFVATIIKQMSESEVL